MKKVFAKLFTVFVCLAAGNALLADDVSQGGDPTDEAADVAAIIVEGEAEADADSESIERLVAEDPQFAELVRWSLLESALSAQDAAGVADVGLALAEAERILLRKHNSGMTADQLLQKAAQMAAANQDEATTGRLKSAAEKLGRPELAAMLAAASNLAAPRRALPASVNVENLDIASAALLAAVNSAIADARITNDASYLQSLETHVAGVQGLSDDLRNYLVQEIQNAVKTIPQETNEADAVLQSLASVSRGVKSIRDNKIAGSSLTYGKLAETFFATYVFPSGLSYTYAGITFTIGRDNVICETFDWDGNVGFWITCRARYSATVNLGPILGKKSIAADRVRVYYKNGNISVDLGGAKGVLNTKGITNWVESKVRQSRPPETTYISYKLTNKTPWTLKIVYSPSGNTNTLKPNGTLTCKSPVKGSTYPKVKATTPGGAWWERTISKPGQTYQVIRKGTTGVQIVP